MPAHKVPPAPCAVEGCTGLTHIPGTAQGLCRSHYRRLREYGEATIPLKKVYRGGACGVEGCLNPYAGAGFCEKHYANLRRIGTPVPPPRTKPRCHCGKIAYGRGLCRRHYDLQRGPRPGGTAERSRTRAQLRRARAVGASGSHSEAEWDAVLAEFLGGCAYCPAPATTKDHVVPLSRGGSHDISNIVPACGFCNSSKGGKQLVVWAGGSRWQS